MPGLKGAKTKLAQLGQAEGPAPSGGAAEVPAGQLLRLPLDEISPDASQPRKIFEPAPLAALAESIKAHGLMQPITVRPCPGDTGPAWLIVAGERRYRAAKLVRLETIPAVVTSGDAKVLALVENLHREDLHPMDEAEALARLKKRQGLKLKDLAVIAGKKASAVSEILKLASLPGDIRQAIRRANDIPRRALVELARLEDPKAQARAFERLKAGEATAETLRQERERKRAPKQSPARPTPAPASKPEPERDTLTREMFPDPNGAVEGAEDRETAAGRTLEKARKYAENSAAYFCRVARNFSKNPKAGKIAANLEHLRETEQAAGGEFKELLDRTGQDPAILRLRAQAQEALENAIRALEMQAQGGPGQETKADDELRRAVISTATQDPTTGLQGDVQALIEWAEKTESMLTQCTAKFMTSEAWAQVRSGLMRAAASIDAYLTRGNQERANHEA